VRVGTPFPATAMAVASIQEFTGRRGLLRVSTNKVETAKVATVTLACLLCRYKRAVDAPS
jgi:hypothetical protein